MKKPNLGSPSFIKEKPAIDFVSETNPEAGYTLNNQKPLYTGRHLVVLTEEKTFEKTLRIFESNLGWTVANTNDFQSSQINESKLENADVLIYDELGVALVSGEEDQITRLEAASDGFLVVPEKIVYVPDDVPTESETPSTWGLDVTQVLSSQFTGKDIKIAVLDTGFDFNHPDFSGRSITSNSFVPEEPVQDMHGHGTHCIGTACGDTNLNNHRYGVAKDSLIYAGKVLSNQGSGAQSWVLSGITWAANNGCKVISMSLGSRVLPGQTYDIAYERAAEFASSKGCVAVAAVGNDSRRSRNEFNPVGSPADCPSILGVAALDAQLNIADFSNRSINPTGQVDIASAGVQVYSSWPMPTRYRTISGTSMATPHVAGILALLWQKYPDASPFQIFCELKNLAQSLPFSTIDVGIGLSIAP